LDVETRLSYVREFAREIVTEKDLRILLETKEHPWAYDGFEPSGLAHIPIAIYRTILTGYLLKAGFMMKYLLADDYAWINNKLGGDLERIRRAGEYFREVWKRSCEVLGVPFDKIEIVWHMDFFSDPEYWRKVILIAKAHSLRRTKRALTIAGRIAAEEKETAIFFYPSMQAADIFHLPVDVPQLGIDQRKVNMLARDVAGKSIELAGRRYRMYKLLGYENYGVNGKPVAVHHKLLPSLTPPPTTLPGFDEDPWKDFIIASKMSKSKPETTILIHDSRKKIFKKLRKAYCPPKSVVEHRVTRTVNGRTEEYSLTIENPVLVYVKEIVFRIRDTFTVKTKEGEETYTSYDDLVKDYDAGKIHPLDLKNALADALDQLIAPIRQYFEEGPGKKLYEELRKYQITR